METAEVFTSMLGLTMDSVTGAVGEEQMVFRSGDRTFTFFHAQDCCEQVRIEDIAGDLQDLLGSPILQAEQVDNIPEPYAGSDSYTWTFYKFATVRGAVTVRWLGESNGYYGESVYFTDSQNPPTYRW